MNPELELTIQRLVELVTQMQLQTPTPEQSHSSKSCWKAPPPGGSTSS